MIGAWPRSGACTSRSAPAVAAAGPTDADESFTEGIGEVVAFVPVPPDAPGHPVRLPSGPSSIVDGQHPWMCSQQERNRRHPS